MAFDPDDYLSAGTAVTAPPPSFDPDAYLKQPVPESSFDPDEYLKEQKPPTPAAPTPSPTATATAMPTVAPSAAPAAEAQKPPEEMWWWERAVRGIGGGFLGAVGTFLKSPLGKAVGAGISPGLQKRLYSPDPAVRQAATAERDAQAEKAGGELQQEGAALVKTAPESFARSTGEVAGGIVPYVAAEATGGPVALLPMLFSDGYQNHIDNARAKAIERGKTPPEGPTAGALADGALNLALGLPVFRAVKGVARAIVPDVAGTVQRTVTQVYERMGIPGVERLVAALSSAVKAGETWTAGHAKALEESLRTLEKEISAPALAALRRVVRRSGEAAATGTAVTTGHNLIAQQSYDPERPTFEKVPEALVTFGALGAIGALGETAGRIRSAKEAQAYLRQKYHERPMGETASETGAAPLAVMTELRSNQPPPDSPATAAPVSPESPASAPAAPRPVSPPSSRPQATAPPTNLQSEIGNLQLPDPFIQVAGTDVVKVPTSAIAVRPELMQFKAIDDVDTGENKNDEITAKYDPLKADNLLLWEPLDQAAYGLTANQRYITADGHHRHSRAVKDNVEFQNAQVLREADGYSASDARTVAAEKNIAGGKGTIFDQVKFIRNLSATHGADVALERAGQIGARGRKAATIALAAEPDLYASFINEQITPEAAAAIANVAPRDPGLQRLGIDRALKGEDPALTANFLQAVKAEMGTRAPTAEQVDLFAADDAAIKAAEKAARRAHQIQREIGEQITSVAGASRRPEKARALGVDVKNPEAVAAKLVELQALRERARNWAMDAAMRDLAMSGEGTAADAVRKLQTSAAPLGEQEHVAEEPSPNESYKLAQNYVADHDIPLDKRKEAADGIARTLSLATDPRLARGYEGQQEFVFDRGGAALAPEPAETPDPTAPGKRPGPAKGARERALSRRGLEALEAGDPAALSEALAANKNRVSTIIPRLISGETPVWNIAGSYIKTPADMMMAVQMIRSPYVESLKMAVVNSRGKVLGSEIVSIGSLNESIAHPREIFRMAMILKADNPGLGIVISHNHPSGDAAPSQSDRTLQRKMQEVADLLQVRMVDHVITNGKQYYSFAREQLSQLAERVTQPWGVSAAEERPLLDTPEAMSQYVATLRAGDPAAAHVIYLSTRYRIKAIERIPQARGAAQSLIIKTVMRGSSREGAYAVMLDLPSPELIGGTVAEQNDVTNKHLLRRLDEALGSIYMVKVLDASWPGMTSARESGLLVREGPAEYRVREQPDFFEDQLAAAERRQIARRQPTPKPKQADMFAGTAQDPFNLAGEKGIDWAARQAETEAAQRQATEARESQEKAQRGLFATPEPPVLGDELQRPPDPADDPSFTAFPVDLPEAVKFAKDLLGVAIQVRKQIKAMGGQAVGELVLEKGVPNIHLRADIADLLSQTEKLQLAQEAAEYAARMSDDPKEVASIAQERYEYLLDQAYQGAKTRSPILALKVIWHEIGHAVDWFPQKMITGRGNLFGHVAALRDYLKHTIPLDPSAPSGKPLTQPERRAMMKEAERQLREQYGPIAEIVETIMVEEPELRIVGLTPIDVRNLFGMDARETMPELYRWFAEQPAEVKKEIVRKAMRDVLDDRLAALGKTEVIGIKRTKRTVRKKVGREPTVEEIAERFKKLFRDELRRRNLAHLGQVKEEIQAAIAWWRGRAVIPEYFKGATEMFADGFSIFLNNPAALQKRAPTFARLLWNYLDAHPPAGALYKQVQNAIKSGQVEDNTEQAMLDSWDAADERSLELAQPLKTTLRDYLDNVSYHLDDRMGPIYRAARGAKLEPEVRAAIGNFVYRASEHELFLNRMNRLVAQPLVDIGLDWKDLGRFMFYKRVTEERFKIFNPYGIAPDRALKRLEKMREKLGPVRMLALAKAQLDFRELYEKHVIAAMREARLWNPELQAAIDHNVFYATFDVRQDDPRDGIGHLLDQLLGANVGPHIYRQVGTVKEIKNPATATVLKSLSLISAAARNIAKRETVRMLREADPQNILEADKRWTGKRWEFIPRENAHVGTVVYLDQGKPSAWYVRRQVADALNKGNSIDNRLVLAGVRATASLKGLFTQLNYAFWPVNFVRDTWSWINQMPGATPIGWARHFPAALSAARASVKGRRNLAAEQALERRMLISRADPQGNWSAVDNEFELKLASYGLNPAMWDRQAERVHTLVKLWNSYREIGQAMERVNKISGMLYLDRVHPDMPEWTKREIVRERAGSPDFLRRGASSAYIDFVMMFYNPWKEGIRSVAKSARENPWSFAAKAVAFVVAPVVLQALAAAGIFGDKVRRKYRSIPDYDLSNYLCIPIGWQNEDQGKVAYIRLPLWEPARILHGTLWHFMTGRGQGLASFYGGTVPSMNALLNVAADWYTYEVMGHNPYDSFRGRNVLSDTQFAAGGWEARKQLLQNSWNSLGGAIAYRFQNQNLDTPPQDRTEKFLQLPIVSNLVNRWVKVSNRGLDDEDRQLTAPVQQQHAQTRLAVQEITRKILAQEALTDSEKHLLWDPYAQDYLRRTLPDVVTSRSSNLSRRLQNKSAEEKALILSQVIRDAQPAGTQ